LAVFLALGAPLFWLASFFSLAFSAATCAPSAATAAVLSVALVSAVVIVWVSFSALVSRMTIDHSRRRTIATFRGPRLLGPPPSQIPQSARREDQGEAPQPAERPDEEKAAGDFAILP
jgi:hypothetical protein